jgi:protein-glutamine gamma-glutamyltransferase
MARDLENNMDDGPQPPRPIATLVREAGVPTLFGLGGLIVAIILAGYAIKIWRRVAPLVSPQRRRARALYRATLDVLAEDGLHREWGESREAFADRERARVPSLGKLTMMHLGVAFGSKMALDHDRMRSQARAVRSELARAVPIWRRFLGLLNPYSWVLAR